MAARRTSDRQGTKRSKSESSEIAARQREAKKTLGRVEEHIGKERLEELLLEGLEGRGEETTAEWWRKLDAEIARETNKTKHGA